MLVTENEARELFCPQSFAVMSQSKKLGEDIFTCKASGCMSWNWFDAKNKGAEHRGFCGLAGRPMNVEL